MECKAWILPKKKKIKKNRNENCFSCLFCHLQVKLSQDANREMGVFGCA